MLLKEYFEKLDDKKVKNIKIFFLEGDKYDLYEIGGEFFCKVLYDDDTVKYYYQPGALMCDAFDLTEEELSTVKNYEDITDGSLCEGELDKDNTIIIESIKHNIESIKYNREHKILNESLDDERY